MQYISKEIAEKIRALAPFVLASSMLHIALLNYLHIQHAPSVNQHKPSGDTHTATVYLEANINPEVKHIENMPGKHKPLHGPLKTRETAVIEHNATSQTAVDEGYAPTPWIDMSMDIVRDEAKSIERSAAEKNANLINSPGGTLVQNLKSSVKETRLANGILKIETPFGTTLCFHPAPEFARESAGLYGIPTRCP